MSFIGSTGVDVAIFRGDASEVRIETSGLALEPVSTAVVPALGGTLFVSVTSPEDVPSAVITDPFWAQTWVSGVFGSEVAEALKAFEDDEFVDRVTATARSGYISEAVNRLGVGFWLHRWWPSGDLRVPELDTRLLELEIAAIAWYAEALFVDTAPIERLLTPHVELLGTLIGDLRRDGVGSMAERELSVLTMGLQATVELVDDSVPGYETCAQLLSDTAREQAVVDALTVAVDWNSVVDELWENLRALIPEPALALASKGTAESPAAPVIAEGSFTVDEQQVPPHTITARDDNGLWSRTSSPSGEDTLTVRVDAAPSYIGPRSAVLLASVGSTVIPLAFDAGSHAFIGSAQVDTAVDAGEIPFVFSPAYVTGRRPDSEVAEDRRRRFEIIQQRTTARDGAGSEFIAERKARADVG